MANSWLDEYDAPNPTPKPATNWLAEYDSAPDFASVEAGSATSPRPLLSSALDTPEATPERSWGEALSDAATRTRQGLNSVVGGIVGAPVNLANLSAYTPSEVVRRALLGEQYETIQQPDAVKGIRESLNRDNTHEQEGLSEKALAQAKAFQEAEGLGASAKFLAENPSYLGTEAAAQIPQLLQLIPGTVAGTIAAQATGAASQNAQQVEEELRNRGMSEQEAADAAAKAFAPSLAINSALPLIPGGSALERVLAGQAGKRVAGSTVARMAVPVVGETVAEGAQEGIDQVIQNAAVGDPLGTNVAQSTILGAAFGAPSGAIAGGVDAALADPNDRIRGLAEKVRIHTPESQAVDAGREIARDMYVAPEAAKPNPAAIDVSQVKSLDTGLPQTFTPGAARVAELSAKSEPTLFEREELALVNPDKSAQLPKQPETLNGGKQVLYRGDVDSIRAKLKEAGLPEGMKVMENGEAVGVKLPVTLREKADAVVTPKPQEAAFDVPPPTEYAAPELARTQAIPYRELGVKEPKPRNKVRNASDFDPEHHDIRDFIALNGGLDAAAFKSEFGVDPAVMRDQDNARFFGKPLFRKSGGMKPDELRERLQSYGWLNEDDPNAPPKYTPQDAFDLVESAMGGTPVFRSDGVDAQNKIRTWQEDQNDAGRRLDYIDENRSIPESDEAFAKRAKLMDEDRYEKALMSKRALRSQRTEEPEPLRPTDEGIETNEIGGDEAEQIIADMRKRQQASLDEKADPLVEGFKELSKNKDLFRNQSIEGDTLPIVAKNAGLTYAGRGMKDGNAAHEIVVDQGEGGKAKATIYEDKDSVWIDVSGLKSGGGAGEKVYNAAASYAKNAGKNFKEDPDGLSDSAMYRRPVQQTAAMLKAGSAEHIEPGDFLATQRPGGPDTRPIAKISNRALDPTLRENLLTAYDNASLAVPEVKNVRFDVDSGRFVDSRTGEHFTDQQFERLARDARANPVRDAMVRTGDSEGGKSPAPVGRNTLKLAALAGTLSSAKPHERPALLDGIRRIAASGLGDSQLKRILPSKRADPQTETPEFRKWFGESKVVDENGEPLRVYHGGSRNIEQFKPSKAWGDAYFFTADKNFALRIASGKRGAVTDAYLSIKNPAIIRAEEYNGLLSIEKALKKSDNDGVIVLNKDGDLDTVIARNPTQIKSSDRNSGAFDPANPSILKSEGAKPESRQPLERAQIDEDVKRVFGTSKVLNRLVNNGTVELITRADAVKKGLGTDKELQGVKGLHDGDKGYLITDELRPNEVAGVLLHEIGVHHSAEKILGADLFNKLQSAMESFKARGDKDVTKAYESVPKDTPEQYVNHEAMAYLAEHSANHKITERLADATKLFANRLGIPLSWLKAEPAAIRKIARESLLAESRGDGKPVAFRDGKTLYHKAWHGTPHEWEGDKADISKIGTGEGAQAYGHGLYFAGKKEIAEHYKNVLSGETYVTPSGSVWTPDNLKHLNMRTAGRKNGSDLDATIARGKDLLASANDQTRPMLTADIAELSSLRDAGGIKKHTGRLYEVDLAPKEADYLDWDKPLSEQSESVKAAIDWVNAKARKQGRGDIVDEASTGEQLYRRAEAVSASAQAVSEKFNELGIPGIRYADSTSRITDRHDLAIIESLGKNNGDVDATVAAQMRGVHNTPKEKAKMESRIRKVIDDHVNGSRNYVIFDDKDVKVTAKYSKRTPKQEAEPTPKFNSATEFWTDHIGKPLFNTISKATKAVVASDLLKRHGLNLAEDMPPEAQKAWRAYKQDVGALKKSVSEIGDEAAKLTPEERSMVSDYVEREMKAGVTPPESVVRMGTLMTSIMRKQSQQLVESGMLSKDAADRWEGRYLPRFYQKHMLTNPFDKMLRSVYLNGIKGSHLKGRGLFESIPVEDVPAYEKMGWQVRDPAMGKTPNLKGLPEGSKVRVWRDFTPAERQKMGEVRDAMYRFARGYTDTQIDIAKGRLFDHIARTVARDDDPGGSYVLVPDTSVPGTGVKKFGNLAGKYVPGDVLSALKSKAGPDSNIVKAYLKALSWWKEGKALALDTPIPTPSGWTTMGDIKVGDIVFDENGAQCEVTYATGVQLERACYEVEFSDGTKIIADAEHLWLTKMRGKTAVRTTQAILDTLKERTRGDNNHSIPVAGQLQTQEECLPIPPYVMGAWLGDGFTKSARICSGAKDADEVIGHIREAGAVIGALCFDKRSGVINFAIRHEDQSLPWVGAMQPTMRNIGVLGNKHIPREYLRASEAQRRELLCGLMDTDGSISTYGKCEFSTTSTQIRDGIVELLRSLGYKPVAREYRATIDGRDCGASWKIKFHAYADKPVFKLARKLARLRERPSTPQRSSTRQIVDVRPIASVPVKCIQVSSESHLYLAGEGMIPTHNTSINPVTHVNNVMSNVVMADLAGVNLADPRSWKLYADTFNDYRKEGKWFKESQKAGLFGGEWYGNEVAQWLPLPDELKDGANSGNIAGKFAMKTANALGSVRNAMGKAYQAEDQFFKLLLYKQGRERGLEPDDAVTWAEKFVFDYSTAAPGVTKLKNTLFPFANYSSKAVPALAFAATHYPWRIAKWIGLLGAFSLYAGTKLYGEDDAEEMTEAEKKLMPPYLKGRSSFFGVPKTIRLPYNDESTGDGMFFDISRFLPLGDLFDAENQSGGVPLPAPLTPNNPLITTAIAMLANKDSFTGKDIVRESDTGGEAAQKRLGWLYRQMAPNNPLVPGSYNFNRLADATASAVGQPIGPYTGLDYNGNTISPARALAQTFGIKLRSVDFEKERGWQKSDLERERADLKGQKTKLKRNQSISETTLESELAKLDEKIDAVSQRLDELSEIPTPERR